MKYKISPLMCFLLAIILIVSPINAKATEVTESGQQGVSVKASIEPSFVVSLPANIELRKDGNTATCTKKIGVKGDIQVSGSVSVTASPNFPMYDVSLRPAGDTTTPSTEDDQNGYPHKTPVSATATQSAVIWPYAELKQLSAGAGFTYDGDTGFHNTDMSIKVTGFTAGKWEGLVNFDISYDDGRAPRFVIGETYSFGGYDWVAVEDKNNYIVLQSTGVTAGKWPGTYKYNGALNKYQATDASYTNISSYNSTMTSLYNSIQNSEYLGAERGTGLYLISQGSYIRNKGYYKQALITATSKYSLLGATCEGTWFGDYWVGYTDTYVDCPYYADKNGTETAGNPLPNEDTCVVAPAFNLDLSKVTLSGNTIIINNRR